MRGTSPCNTRDSSGLNICCFRSFLDELSSCSVSHKNFYKLSGYLILSIFYISLDLSTLYFSHFSVCWASFVCSCHSIPECCIMFSGVKLSIGSFALFFKSSLRWVDGFKKFQQFSVKELLLYNRIEAFFENFHQMWKNAACGTQFRYFQIK